MLIEVKVPPLAESVAEATLGQWHKHEGDPVAPGENLVDIETDKVTLEVTAPEGGVLKETRKEDNASVTGEEVIAVIDTDAPKTQGAAAGPESGPRSKTPKLGPAVRRLLDEHGLRPSQIPAANVERLTKADVQQYLESRQTEPARRPPAPAPAQTTEQAALGGERPERRVPMSRLRRRIAERLLAAQQQSAILTTFNEVDMQAVMALRSRYKARFEATHGIKLGFMSFFVAAAVQALRRFPVVNAFIEGDEVVYHDYFDIGIAVSAPRGLVVPILRDAERLGMAQIEQVIAELAQKARDNTLSIEELSGGTFTITNGGVFGSLLSTPILNPPQSAILGMHKIQPRPVAENDQVVVRPMMYLALSYDHRLIDGREAVQFLVTIKELIEDPSRLLLQV